MNKLFILFYESQEICVSLNIARDYIYSEFKKLFKYENYKLVP